MSEEKDSLSPTPEGEQEQATVQQETTPTRSRTRGQQKRRQKSVFQYIAVLFAAAFVLLLFTFLMERRQNQLLQEQNQEQLDDLQQSVSAVQSLQNLYDENASLKQQVDALTEQLAQAKNQADASKERANSISLQMEQTSKAMDWFWQIDEAYVRGKYSLCRSLIGELEQAGLVDALPKQSTTDNGRFSPAERYQEIYEKVF